jgi:hypothetical protein
VYTKAALDGHLVLRPFDSSTTRIVDVLRDLPIGSIVILASRQPTPWIVDAGRASEVSECLEAFGLQPVTWPGAGAHVVVGVAGSAAGTGVEIAAGRSAEWRVMKGQEIGSTGVVAPVPIYVVSSLGDVDLIVSGRNVSGHHWGYQMLALEPHSGRILELVDFDTETFLVSNTRVYQLAGVRGGNGTLRLDPSAWSLPGLVLDLSDRSSEWYLGEGWSASETWGTWSIGAVSDLRIALPTAEGYRMVIEAMPYCAEGTDQTLVIGWNGVAFTRLAFNGCGMQKLAVELPGIAESSTINHIEFAYGYALSPFEVSGGTDPDRRELGVGFVKILFEPTG